MSRIPTVSVLICTYQRHLLLYQALEALVCKTSVKPDQVVVVNGGDDQADEVVQKYQANGEVDVVLVKTRNVNLATSRNVGLPLCKGDIVAMTDDDARVFPDWILQHRRAHEEHPEAGAVGGVVIGTNTDGMIGKVADAITFPSWRGPQYVRTLPGVNISYKRQALDAVGEQDVSLFRGEDVDFNWRIQKEGWKVFFDPAIKVYHYHRPTLRGFLNQHYMYGRAYYLVRRKWPEMYCLYPHQIQQPKDILKAGHFFVSAFYEPFVNCQKVSGRKDQFLSLPPLFLAGIYWRIGMIRQYQIERKRNFGLVPA